MTLKKYKGFIFLILVTCAFLICSVKGDAYWGLDWTEIPIKLVFPSFVDSTGADMAFETNSISTREQDSLKGSVRLIKYGEVNERSMGKLVINEDKLRVAAQYNKNGQKISLWDMHYIYDNGRLIEKRSSDEPESVDFLQTKYSYDKGQLVFIEDYRYPHTKTATITYDDKGRVKEIKRAFLSDFNTFIFLYDNKGRISKIYHQNSDGIDTGLTEFTYDANGFLYNADSKFDKYGRILRDAKNTYEYDSKGYLVKKTAKSYSGTEVLTYTYKYDSKGNWIQRDTLRDGKSIIVEARFIYYYE